MHSWKKMVDLLERVDRPETLGLEADMAHTLLYLLGYNAPEDAILPAVRELGGDQASPFVPRRDFRMQPDEFGAGVVTRMGYTGVGHRHKRGER